MKLYAKEATAQAIATKLTNNGEAHEVVEHDGQWAVVPEGQSVVEDETGNLGPVTEDGTPLEQGDEAEAPAEEDSTVTVEFPGARMTAQYVITQPIGSGKKGPVERWIERARCKSAEATENGVRVTLSRKALKTRGINADDFAITEAA